MTLDEILSRIPGEKKLGGNGQFSARCVRVSPALALDQEDECAR
jgi:hypothetical protein